MGKRILLFLYFLPGVIFDSIQAMWWATDKLDPLKRVEYGFFVYYKNHDENN
jgi:hypothetical protein